MRIYFNGDVNDKLELFIVNCSKTEKVNLGEQIYYTFGCEMFYVFTKSMIEEKKNEHT